jgi:hypothetical protein
VAAVVEYSPSTGSAGGTAADTVSGNVENYVLQIQIAAERVSGVPGCNQTKRMSAVGKRKIVRVCACARARVCVCACAPVYCVCVCARVFVVFLLKTVLNLIKLLKQQNPRAVK